MRTPQRLVVTTLALLLGSWALPVDAAEPVDDGPVTQGAAGGALPGSDYVALTPCRVVDTRVGSPLGSGAQRAVQIAGEGANFAIQGGKPNGCGIPDGVAAVEGTITAVDPTGAGFLRAWPNGSPATTATFLNYTRNESTTNTGSLSLAYAGFLDLRLQNFGATTDYVIDVQGYFAEVPTFGAQAVFVPLTPCRIADSRATSPYSNGSQRVLEVKGGGTAFAAQGGRSGGCAIPEKAIAIEAALSAVDPAGNGFVRAWPGDVAPPTATFLNYTNREGTTNTGALALASTGTQDLRVRNFGGRTHVVLDVTGYYARREDLPNGVTGASYVPQQPCRVVDTRATGRLGPSTSASFRVGGSGSAFAAQGGRSGGCGVPDDAAAVEASVSAVDPISAGFGRFWPTGVTPPTATFINYSARDGITNTGAVALATTGASDLSMANYGGPSHYVIDIQGFFVLAGPVDFTTTTRVDAGFIGYGASMAGNGRFVDYAGLPAISGSVSDIFRWDRTTGARTRITSGNADSYDVRSAPSGNYLVFTSVASNLVAGDTNGKADVFLYRQSTGVVTRITAGNGDSTLPVMSGNDRFVLFRSRATDLVSGDTNGQPDLFLFDRNTSTTTRLTNVDNEVLLSPQISIDGRYVAFVSGATNIVPGGAGGLDGYVLDRTLGTFSRELSGSGPTRAVSMSRDGRWLAFESAAADLVPDDTNGYDDVFLKDRTSGTITAVTQGNRGSRLGAISEDGGSVTFSSTSSDLATGVPGGIASVYRWNKDNQHTDVVGAGWADSDAAAISADGTRVVFLSYSGNLASAGYSGPGIRKVYDWDGDD